MKFSKLGMCSAYKKYKWASLVASWALECDKPGYEAEGAHADQLAQTINGTSFPAQTQKKSKRKCTLPTQALSCSGSKGLSQPHLPAFWPISQL